MLKSIIIDGVDRLGKDTLISGIKNKLGFFQTVHYQKPEILECFMKEARTQLNLGDDVVNSSVLSYAQKNYQIKSFGLMFQLLSTEDRFIMNRSHLGEFVYAPRYRGYSGDYVFDQEVVNTDFSKTNFCNTTLLVLLHTSSFEFIKDDGLSLDFNKKDDEQMDFVRAFEKSNIKHKLMLDVHDGDGNFVPPDRLLDVVVHAYKELQTMQHQIMNVSWSRDAQGGYDRHNYLQPDLKKLVS